MFCSVFVEFNGGSAKAAEMTLVVSLVLFLFFYLYVPFFSGLGTGSLCAGSNSLLPVVIY